MTDLTLAVDAVYADTFSVVRTNDPLFTNTRNEINSSTYATINGTTYKLVLRHYDLYDTHMFFWIVKPGYEATYGTYYSAPYDFGGGYDAWDLDPVAWVASDTLLEASQQLTITYTAGTPVTTLSAISISGEVVNVAHAAAGTATVTLNTYVSSVNVTYTPSNNTSTVDVSGANYLIAGSNTITITVTNGVATPTTYTVTVNVQIPDLDTTYTVEEYIATYSPSRFNITSNGRYYNYITILDVSGSCVLSHNGTNYGTLSSLPGYVDRIVFGIHSNNGTDYTINSIYLLNNISVLILTEPVTLTLNNLIGTSNVGLFLRNTYNGVFVFKNNLTYTSGSHSGDLYESGEINIDGADNNGLSSDTTLATFTVNSNAVADGDTVILTNGTTSVTVVATPTNNNATVDISGASGLVSGPQNCVVTVTAEDGTIQTYTIILRVASIVVTENDFDTAPQNITNDVPFNVTLNSQTFEFIKSTPTSDPSGALVMTKVVDGRSLSVNNLPNTAAAVIVGTNNENNGDFTVKVNILDADGNKISDLSNNPITLRLYFPGATTATIPIYTKQTIDGASTFATLATLVGNGIYEFTIDHLTYFSTNQRVSHSSSLLSGTNKCEFGFQYSLKDNNGNIFVLISSYPSMILRKINSSGTVVSEFTFGEYQKVQYMAVYNSKIYVFYKNSFSQATLGNLRMIQFNFNLNIVVYETIISLNTKQSKDSIKYYTHSTYDAIICDFYLDNNGMFYMFSTLRNGQTYYIFMLKYNVDTNTLLYEGRITNESSNRVGNVNIIKVDSNNIYLYWSQHIYKMNKTTYSFSKKYFPGYFNNPTNENFIFRTDNIGNIIVLSSFGSSSLNGYLNVLKIDSNLNRVNGVQLLPNSNTLPFDGEHNINDIIVNDVNDVFISYKTYTKICLLKLNLNFQFIFLYDLLVPNLTKGYINSNFVFTNSNLYFIYTSGLKPLNSIKYSFFNANPTQPSAPLNFVTTDISVNSISLSWSAPSSPGTVDGTVLDTINKYTISYINNGVNTIINNATSPYTVTGLVAGTTYIFKVNATSKSGLIGPDATVEEIIATVPAAPVITSADGAGTSATVTWTKPANGGATITGYTVTVNGTDVNVNGENTLTTTLTGLTTQTVYTVTVKAINSIGTSAASAEAKFYLFTFVKDSSILSNTRNLYSSYEVKTLDSPLLSFKTSNNKELSIIQARAAAKATNAIFNLTSNQQIILRRNINSSLRSNVDNTNILISSSNISKFLETFNNFSSDLNVATSITFVPQQIIRDADGPCVELDVENISSYKAVEIPINCKLILKSGATLVPLKFKGTYYEPWAGGAPINIDDQITVGSTNIKLFAVGSGIFGPGNNDGGGGNGDPYVTTISNDHYKLPCADIPIRFYQGMVGEKQLTVNATLRTVRSTEIIGSNLLSFMELKDKIPAKSQQKVIDRIFGGETMCFFEKVYVSYGDSHVILNVWDRKFVVLAKRGDEIKSRLGSSTTPDKYTKEYKNYANQTLTLICDTAKVHVSVYNSAMVRNGIFVEAPHMEAGNGVIVNTLSRADMTIGSLVSDERVPNRDTAVKTHRETFIDARGMRVRTIAHV